MYFIFLAGVSLGVCPLITSQSPRVYASAVLIMFVDLGSYMLSFDMFCIVSLDLCLLASCSIYQSCNFELLPQVRH